MPIHFQVLQGNDEYVAVLMDKSFIYVNEGKVVHKVNLKYQFDKVVISDD